MRMFIEVIAPRDPNTPHVRVAGLVSHEADYALARAYEALAVGVLPIRGQVFKVEAEAIRWVSSASDGRPADD